MKVVGIDILEIDRFVEIEKDETKMSKMFTEKEIEYFNKLCNINYVSKKQGKFLQYFIEMAH